VELGLGESAAGQSAVAEPAVAEPALGESVLGEPVSGEPAFGESAEPARRLERSRLGRLALRWTGTLVLPAMVYVALGMLRIGSAWAAPDRLAQCGCGDAAFVMWFLGWTPFAAAHGHSLFFTDWMFYPTGLNVLWNASLPLPALLAGPVAARWGVIAAYNVLVVVGFAGSALSAYLVLRRWARWPPAAFVGGLLYGFSPYMIGQGRGHLHMFLVLLVPVTLLLLDEALVRQRRPAWLVGPMLGAVLAAQLFTAEEVLASMALVGMIGLGVLLALFPRKVRARLRHGALTLVLAAATTVVLTAVPLRQQFAGPQRLQGLVSDPDRYPADLLGWVVPTGLVRFTSEAALRTSRAFAGNLAENGSYLGIPLLVVVLLTALLLWRRRPVVRWALVTLVLVMAFASGPSLHIRGRDTGAWMPLAMVRGVPLLQSVVGVRLALYAVLLAALLLAVGLDALHDTARDALTRVDRQPGRLRLRFRLPGGPRWLPGWLGHSLAVVPPVALALVALLPLLPRSFQYPVGDARIPAWFQSASVVHRVPQDSVLLMVPGASSVNSSPMLWQAAARFRFKIPSGFALNPRPEDGRGTFNAPPSYLMAALNRFRLGRPPRVDEERIMQMRVELAGWSVRTVVVVTETNANVAEQVDLLTRVVGRPPVHDSGAWVWYDVKPSRLVTLPVHPAPWPLGRVRLPPG